MDVFERCGTAVELDSRWNDGITVMLLWEPHADALIVTVHDSKNGDAFELQVAPSFALDAFRHPYAYYSRDARAAVSH
jgi:hypothetical protein